MTQTYGEKADYILLQISVRRLLQFFPNFKSLRFFTLIPGSTALSGNSEDPRKYLMEMLTIYEEKKDGYPLLFSARLYELLHCLYTSHSRWITSDSPQTAHQYFFTRIIKIMSWVNEHYQEPISLDEASNLLGLSREYFCRIFKKYTGQTFLEYVNDIRVMKLYEELSYSDDTITNLMEKHGITNYKIFLRTFKKLYGTTPHHLRKNAVSDHHTPSI